jgi:hypothetical protein
MIDKNETDALIREDDEFMEPPIEANIPLPKNALEAMPELTQEEELLMRANTIKLISDLTGEPIIPTNDQKTDAISLAKQIMSNPNTKIDFTSYPNETMAFLAGLVAETKYALVEDLTELKMFVINGLVREAGTAKEAKIRISALSKLGEIDGVDAFKKRTEVTVKQQSMEEVEDELLKILSSIKGKVIEGEVVEKVVNDE